MLFHDLLETFPCRMVENNTEAAFMPLRHLLVSLVIGFLSPPISPSFLGFPKEKDRYTMMTPLQCGQLRRQSG